MTAQRLKINKHLVEIECKLDTEWHHLLHFSDGSTLRLSSNPYIVKERWL